MVTANVADHTMAAVAAVHANVMVIVAVATNTLILLEGVCSLFSCFSFSHLADESIYPSSCLDSQCDSTDRDYCPCLIVITTSTVIMDGMDAGLHGCPIFSFCYGEVF